jgi:uncharacterized protein YcfJ
MKTFFLTAALAVFASASTASESVNATITDHYRTVSHRVPYTETVCQTVQIPVYGSTGSVGNTVAGAIIGGAVGNQFGNGSGRDAMTVLGAIVGADVANRSAQNNTVVGYRSERQCDQVTHYTTRQERVYSHSTVTWREHGSTFSVDFTR